MKIYIAIFQPRLIFNIKKIQTGETMKTFAIIAFAIFAFLGAKAYKEQRSWQAAQAEQAQQLSDQRIALDAQVKDREDARKAARKTTIYLRDTSIYSGRKSTRSTTNHALYSQTGAFHTAISGPVSIDECKRRKTNAQLQTFATNLNSALIGDGSGYSFFCGPAR